MSESIEGSGSTTSLKCVQMSKRLAYLIQSFHSVGQNQSGFDFLQKDESSKQIHKPKYTMLQQMISVSLEKYHHLLINTN